MDAARESSVSDDELVARARRVRDNAYAPYSRFAVGAALLTRDGAVVTGANVENAAYGSTICAERAAVCRAIAEGQRDFVAVAIVADAEPFCPPCGACRQVLAEFNPRLRVLMSSLSGPVTEVGLAELLPHSFGPGSLPVP